MITDQLCGAVLLLFSGLCFFSVLKQVQFTALQLCSRLLQCCFALLLQKCFCGLHQCGSEYIMTELSFFWWTHPLKEEKYLAKVMLIDLKLCYSVWNTKNRLTFESIYIWSLLHSNFTVQVFVTFNALVHFHLCKQSVLAHLFWSTYFTTLHHQTL